MADNSMVFGYARVSSKDQNEARQIQQLTEAGVDERHIFIDKESGRDYQREQYQAMMTMLREGDVIFVTSLDRLGRNYAETLKQWTMITKEKKADIVVMDMPILDTRKQKDLTGTLISDIVLQLLSYVAQREREYIRRRQQEGIELAKQRGVYKGRKPIPIDKAQFEELYAQVVSKERTNKWVMKQLGLNQGTYSHILKQYKTKTGRWAPEKEDEQPLQEKAK
jgi:DNA invertase Pin-like site-specific DNA recombinase